MSGLKIRRESRESTLVKTLVKIMDVSPNGFSQIRAFIEKKENQNPSSRSKVMSVLVNIIIILTKNYTFIQDS